MLQPFDVNQEKVLVLSAGGEPGSGRTKSKSVPSLFSGICETVLAGCRQLLQGSRIVQVVFRASFDS